MVYGLRIWVLWFRVSGFGFYGLGFKIQGCLELSHGLLLRALWVLKRTGHKKPWKTQNMP